MRSRDLQIASKIDERRNVPYAPFLRLSARGSAVNSLSARLRLKLEFNCSRCVWTYGRRRGRTPANGALGADGREPIARSRRRRHLRARRRSDATANESSALAERRQADWPSLPSRTRDTPAAPTSPFLT